MYSKHSLQYVLSRSGGSLHLEVSSDHAPPAPKNGRRILIIGGGVTGLTTAWTCLDAGYYVTIIAEQWAPAVPRITSQIAGALWEWPPAVCGKHFDNVSLRHSKRWCLISYKIFLLLSQTEASVRMRLANFFFHKKLEELPENYLKMIEMESSGTIEQCMRNPGLITRHDIHHDASVVDAFTHLAPVIDTDAYMVWLRNLVASKGAQFVSGRVRGDLLDSEDELLAEYHANAIVNATGLGSKELAADSSVFPLRGALIRLVNDGKKFPKITEALCVSHNDSTCEDQDIVFIVPRNDNVLILGGIAQQNQWNLDLTLDSPEIKCMRERCNRFVLNLENAEYDPQAPLVQGLRPSRKRNVRVERELRPHKRTGSHSRIVHSYGHGGAGFSLSFGCALDVLQLIKEIEVGVSPRPMDLVLWGMDSGDTEVTAVRARL